MSGFYPSYGAGAGAGAGQSGLQQPDLSVAAAAVSRMSVEELRGLLDDEEKCERFVKGLDQVREEERVTHAYGHHCDVILSLSPPPLQVKGLYSEKEMLMASNKSLAEYNLSQEQPLTDARCKLQEKHRETRRMTEKVKNLKREVEEKGGSTEPDTMLALLQVKLAIFFFLLFLLGISSQ